MSEETPPTRPQSEYGEKPAGAPPGEPRGAEAPTQPRPADALDAHRDAVLGILARGEDMGAAAIASEISLDATQVSALLTRLEHDGAVTRTASGNWRGEPATLATTEAQASPKEPDQGE